MEHAISIGLAVVILLGVGAQWIAHKIQMPSILLLIVAGFTAGPLMYAWEPSLALLPDRLLGNLLYPIVSISVGIILFEGGLSLNLKEVDRSRNIIIRLLSIGVLATWIGSALLAWWILDFEPGLAILLGAILTVTGPTVIGPMLRYIRPIGEAGPILKWEGILVDPIGAILAVLVYELIATDMPRNHQFLFAASVLAKTLASGVLIGGGAAGILFLALLKKQIPEFLQTPVALMLLIAAFTAANSIQSESGLLATTIMGIVLANQRRVPIRHIVEFKEVLRTLLISSIFILLAANIKLDTLKKIDGNTFLFLGALLFLVRPLSVFLSSLGSRIPWKQRIFLAALAPRGIVAAAIGSVLALELKDIYPNAGLLNSTLFFVIVGSIALYGLSASPVARLLGISGQDPQGVLIVGAHYWARELAQRFRECGLEALLVDANAYNVDSARAAGLTAIQGNILDDSLLDQLNLEGIGYLLAITSNDEANALACLQFSDIFGKDHVHQISPWNERNLHSSGPQPRSYGLAGQCLMGREWNFGKIADLISSGAALKILPVEKGQTIPSSLSSQKKRLHPVALLSQKNKIRFFSEATSPELSDAKCMIAFVTKK